MIAEIETYQDQLLSITQDVPGLIGRLSDEQFNWRPAANRWSMAECFDHLNVTAALFVPAIDGAIADARARKLESEGPFTYPLLERLFLRMTEPPPKMRFRAPKVLIPGPDKTVTPVLTEFMDWQRQLGDRLQRADGVDLARARYRSPAVSWVTWRLGTIFAVMLAHERRHVWQARGVRNDPRFPG
jgi:hypothetical protein